MPLTAGARLGPYEIVAPLGAGGMGEVYRARDTRLDRTVALKILPDSLAADPQFRDRFDREARTISQLSHPHICALFDVGHQEGVHFLVMEYLEGETLGDRMARSRERPLPLPEALRIAIEIAGALDAAHRQGVVHRDLKPGNVMLTKSGAKLLDFGLAKTGTGGAGGVGKAGWAGTANLTSPPTMTTPLTATGSILGTFQYMSPEQLEGADADERSDIFAFGAVLFEMIAGQKAFSGKSQVGVMAAILEHDPPSLTALQPAAPPALARVVNTCLAKDPDARWQNTRDLRRELEWIAESLARPAATDSGVALDGSPADARGSSARAKAGGFQASVVFAGAFAIAAASMFATWVVQHWRPAPTPQPMRFAIAPSASQQPGPMLPGPGAHQLAIAPDGRHLVYIAYGGQFPSPNAPAQLMVRAIDQLDPVPLRGLAVPRSPFMSPDGKWIGYFEGVNGGLKKVSITGGPPIAICPAAAQSLGASWGPDDTIVFATADPTVGLQAVPAAGGAPKVLAKADPAHGELIYAFPSFLPNGRAVLFTIAPTSTLIENAQVAVLDLKTGQRKILIRGGTDATYVEPSAGPGYLVYAASGALRATRFDAVTLEVSGDPMPVVDQVLTLRGAAQFTVSRTGTLVYVPGGEMGSAPGRTLVWIDRSGRETAIAAPPRSYAWARISPDGSRLALDARDQEQDVWIFDLGRQTMARLTIDPGLDGFPLWTSDGKRILFESTRSGVFNVFWQAADGTGAAQQLTKSANPMWPYSLSPDGTRLVVQENAPKTGPDLDMLVLDGKSRPEPLIQTKFNETNAEISPDGRWLAYQSNESGSDQIYVQPFPNVNDGHWQVSPAGGTIPAWNPNGRELFYLAGRSMMAVPIQTSTGFSAGNPTKLFDAPPTTGPPMRYYDVSRDGQKFLMIKDPPAAQQTTPASMVVVLNWFEELKARVGR